MTCEGCGRANREGARFCDACGAPLGTVAAPTSESADARKVVTIVFADLAGSTLLQERLDPESARQLMDRYYAAMRAAVDAHHGTVVKLLGDGVMAVFGVPHVAEDDALRAVRAAHEMQARFGAVTAARPGLGDDFGLRIGINTGEVVVAAADDDVVGDPVNVAARLEGHAGLGEILLGEPTRRLVDGLVTLEPAGELQLKGRAELVAAHRLVSLDPPVTRAATRLVGRAPELERLEQGLDAVVAGGAGLTVVLGSPGLGKTRLLDEFDSRVGDRVTVLTGRCGAAGLATFAPIAEALRAVTGVGDAVPADTIRSAVAALVPDDEPERDRIVDRAAGLLGAGAPASSDETFWAVRRLLAGLARSRPVVLVLDDLHWAEPLLLDLVEHVVEWSRDVPLLVVGAARPELRDMRSSLTTPGGRADVIVLDALDAGAATQLAADVLGAAELPAAVAGRVLAASEGNPLFVRELVRMLVDDGVLQRDGERWEAATELAAVEMPPTIHALLASRLERLHPDQRAVIERAAVIGRQFSRAALDHLLTPDLALALDDHLDALRHSELIEPDDSRFLGEPVLRFHHALIRDAAYRGLLKGTRAELHEHYADWLGDRLDTGAPDRDDTLGWHLEQAHTYLVELERDDEHARELGQRAAEHLERAGRQALECDDLTVAASLLGRALDRLGPGAPGRAELELERCEALLAAGEVTGARRAVDGLAATAPDDPRLTAWHTAFVAQLTILTEPERLPEIVESIAPVADAMRAAGDVSGEAKAHYVHALALSRLGQVGPAEAALDRALAAARAAGDRRLANAVLSSAPLAALWGPSPVTRASGRCLDVVRVLRITAGAPAVEAVALRCQAVLEALRGRVDAARRMLGSARRTLEDLGLTHRLLETEVFAGLVELYDGDSVAAEARLRPAFEQLRARGLGGEAAQAAALLGRALLLQGCDAEADALGHEAEALAGADLKAAIAWRGVQAEAAARRGDDEVALRLAREAVDLAADTDALLDHADARLVLAAVLRAVGDEAAATAEAQRAADLYEAKGATVLAERAAQGTATPARPAPSSAPEASTRRGRENLATENSRLIAQAMSEGDHDFLESLFANGCTYFQHDIGETVDRTTHLATLKATPPGGRAEIEVLAAPGDRFALERVSWWFPSMRIGASTAGEASLELLVVTEVDAQGRAVWTAGYAVDQFEDAASALSARTGRPLAADMLAEPPVENVASTSMQRSGVSLSVKDWETYVDCFAPTCRITDRRGFTRVDLNCDEFLASFRTVMDFDEVRASNEILATRGQLVALSRQYLWGRSVDGAESDFEILSVARTDESGRAVRIVWLQPDDLDGARAELERIAAEDAAAPNSLVARALRVWARRDWDGFAALLAPDFRQVDRRAFGGGELTRDAFLENFRTMFDDDWTMHRELVDLRDERVALVRVHFAGNSGASGASEVDALIVDELDEDGLVRVEVVFDPDDLQGARAEFDRLVAELGAAEPVLFENAATWLEQRFVRAWAARDWEAVVATYAHGYRWVDRRAITRIELDRDEAIATTRQLFDMSDSEWIPTLVATRGDRLALTHYRVRFEGRGAGASEVEMLNLVEVDESGDAVWRVIFEAGDLDAAFDQLDERFACGEGVSTPGLEMLLGFPGALNRQDWDAVSELFDPEFVLHDHRPLGFGVLPLPEYEELLRALVELAPEVGMRLHHVLAVGERAAIVVGGLSGTIDGQPVDRPLVILMALEDQRFRRWDSYDFDQLDEAWARYRALGGLDQLENEAARAVRSSHVAWTARDWEAYADHYSSSCRFVDRKSVSRTEVGRDEFLASMRAPFGFEERHVAVEILATRGERLVLTRETFTGSTRLVGESETSQLELTEIDEDGRFEVVIWFDPDDLDAAHEALDFRYVAIEPRISAATMDVTRRFREAYAARNWDAAAEATAPTAEFVDHRPLGWGVLDRDGYLASLRTLPDVAPDAGLRMRHVIDASDRAALAVWEVSGSSGFEIQTVIVNTTDDFGRIRRLEIYDLDQLDEARARYEHVSQSQPPERFANLATRHAEAMRDAWNAHDWDGVQATLARSQHQADHRGHAQLDLSSRDRLVDMRMQFDAGLVNPGFTLLATRGQRLALYRTSLASPSGDVEFPYLCILSVDDDGLEVDSAIFDVEQLDEAYATLDDWYAAGEASPHGDRWAAMRRYAAHYGTLDLDQVRATLADTFALHDHRRLGWGTLDQAGYLDVHRVMNELSPDATLRYVHVLGLDARSAIIVTRTIGVPESGQFEIPFVSVNEFNEIGLRVRTDFYDLDQLDEALERYAAVESLGSTPSISNAVTRQRARFVRAWRAHDWSAVAAAFADDHRMRDGRSLVRLDYGAGAELTDLQTIFESQAMDETFDLLATRGERLALFRSSITVSRRTDATRPGVYESMGLAEIGRLVLHEVDDQERFVLTNVFDADAVDTAFEALDARYAEGEAARFADRWAVIRRFASRYGRVDLDEHARGVTDDYVVVDHRPLGWGRLDKTGYLEQLRVINELSPDAVSRIDHVPGLCERGSFVVTTTVGSPVSGQYEIPVASVAEYDASGRLARTDYYALDQLDDAWTRYHDLGAVPTFENAAAATMRRFARSWLANDWDSVIATLAGDYRTSERRSLVQLESDTAESLETLRLLFDEAESVWQPELLATRGRNLSLFRQRFSFAGLDSGPSELVWLELTEVDEDGRCRSATTFDADDLDAAYDELDARFVAGEGAALAAAMELTRQFMAAYDARDWSIVRDLISPSSTFHDHRLMGFGRFDRDGYLEWLAAIPELSADAKIRTRHVLASDARRGLGVLCAEGGGDERFEIPFALVTARDDAGLTTSMDFYGLEQLDDAWARYHELAEVSAPSVDVPPNAASRAFATTTGFFNAREVERYREACSPDVVFEDRQHHLALGIEAWIEDARFVTGGVPDVQMATDLVATAGDRLAVVRVTFAGSVAGGGPFRTEFLQVLEVDPGGLLTAVLKYEPDDRMGTFGEMQRRFAEGEAAAYPEAARLLRELTLAVLTDDWDAWLATLADDFTIVDRRAAGLGSLSGPDWVDAQRVMRELSPDVALTATEVLAIDHHGWIIRVRIVGTLADGGPFENDHLDLFTIAGDRITHVELFEPEAAADARVRFEELRPELSAIQTNAATRAERRRAAAFEARDWQGWLATLAESMTFDDRRPLVRTAFDREQFFASTQHIARGAARFTSDVLATAGDRLALDHVHWVIDETRGHEVEMDLLTLHEVGHDARTIAFVNFDMDDRVEAFAEMERRFVTGEAAQYAAGQSPISAFDAAFAARDWGALRDALAVDFVATDNRPAWMGSSDRAEYVESMRVFAGLSPDVVSESLCILAWDDRGRVVLTRVTGTQQDAGPFESVFVSVFTTAGGKVRRLEVFDPEDADLAREAFASPRP